jgi:hypothetical protein
MTGERLTSKPGNVRVGGALTSSQRAYAEIARRLAEPYPSALGRSAEAQEAFLAGLREALEIIRPVDPEADSGEAVPGRVY